METRSACNLKFYLLWNNCSNKKHWATFNIYFWHLLLNKTFASQSNFELVLKINESLIKIIFPKHLHRSSVTWFYWILYFSKCKITHGYCILAQINKTEIAWCHSNSNWAYFVSMSFVSVFGIKEWEETSIRFFFAFQNIVQAKRKDATRALSFIVRVPQFGIVRIVTLLSSNLHAAIYGMPNRLLGAKWMNGCRNSKICGEKEKQVAWQLNPLV